jgi:8-oxo-dGTP diphosphatase
MAKNHQYTYEYPRPMVSVDTVVFTVRDGRLELVGIRRKHEPYAGQWALPGGFIEMDETLSESAGRELYEEVGIKDVFLEQSATFGRPGRDPRGRVVSVTYIAAVDWRRHPLRADDDAAEAAWLPVADLPPLAFDHDEIVAYAVTRLKELIDLGHVDTPLFAEVSAEQFQRALSVAKD